VVLDYGSGWGNTSFTLSYSCRTVIGMDTDINRLRFSSAHFAQNSRSNIACVAAGNAPHLPFQDSTFDAVIMNGVLEWTPANTPGIPEEVHRRILGEVWRVLKPGGALQVSIENRYGYMYFLGKRDNHSGGLRFVTFLPRWLSQIYSRVILGRDYRTWLYSFAQLKRLMSGSGFAGTEIYTYYPNHVQFRHMFSLENDDTVRRKVDALLESETLKISERCIFYVTRCRAWFRHIAQDYMVVTRKPGHE
jgi:ubiquinone/menaquinone biosynthesis C-methylase UbiE